MQMMPRNQLIFDKVVVRYIYIYIYFFFAEKGCSTTNNQKEETHVYYH